MFVEKIHARNILSLCHWLTVEISISYKEYIKNENISLIICIYPTQFTFNWQIYQIWKDATMVLHRIVD